MSGKALIPTSVLIIVGFIIFLLVMWRCLGTGSREKQEATDPRWSRWSSGLETQPPSTSQHKFDTTEVERINQFFDQHDSLRSQTSQKDEESRIVSTYDEVLSLREDIVSTVEISLPTLNPLWLERKRSGLKPTRRIPKFMDRGQGWESEGEHLCRDVMEAVYGKKFPKAHPAWLKNPETGGSLELDCYNEELKIAVEYNGEQHYKWPSGFNMSFEDFQQQVRRDRYKKEMCERLGVYLIIVPYDIPTSEIPSYLYNLLPENS